jgi:hypothetical protein
MSAYDEERLGKFLRVLRPAPDGWVRAAQELPFARLDEIVARVEADLEFRKAVVADLEAALAQAGYEPNRWILGELVKRLPES